MRQKRCRFWSVVLRSCPFGVRGSSCAAIEAVRHEGPLTVRSRVGREHLEQTGHAQERTKNQGRRTRTKNQEWTAVLSDRLVLRTVGVLPAHLGRSTFGRQTSAGGRRSADPKRLPDRRQQRGLMVRPVQQARPNGRWRRRGNRNGSTSRGPRRSSLAPAEPGVGAAVERIGVSGRGVHGRDHASVRRLRNCSSRCSPFSQFWRSSSRLTFSRA